MKKQKGQAALEFLTTYGWAFLVILVTIGALYYFGVFDVSNKIPESCTLDAPVSCGDTFALADNGTLQIYLINTAVRSINVSNIELVDEAGNNYNNSISSGIIAAGDNKLFSVDLSNAQDLEVYTGEKTKFDVSVTYEAAQITKTIQGTLNVRVAES